MDILHYLNQCQTENISQSRLWNTASTPWMEIFVSNCHMWQEMDLFWILEAEKILASTWRNRSLSTKSKSFRQEDQDLCQVRTELKMNGKWSRRHAKAIFVAGQSAVPLSKTSKSGIWLSPLHINGACTHRATLQQFHGS